MIRPTGILYDIGAMNSKVIAIKNMVDAHQRGDTSQLSRRRRKGKTKTKPGLFKCILKLPFYFCIRVIDNGRIEITCRNYRSLCHCNLIGQLIDHFILMIGIANRLFQMDIPHLHRLLGQGDFSCEEIVSFFDASRHLEAAGN